jgi:hypothetical protein
MLCASPVFAQGQDITQEQAGAWLRIYPKYVQGVYVKAEDYQHDAAIKPESVVVALTDEPDEPNLFPTTSLISFVSGKAVSKQGCVFLVDSSGLDISSPLDRSSNASGIVPTRDVCGHFRLRIVGQMKPQAVACSKYGEYEKREWTLRNGPIGLHLLFISHDLRQVHCLINILPIWVEPTEQSGMAFADQVRIEGDRSMKAYLHLESNNIVHCYDFGKPVTYFHKALPEAVAIAGNYPFYMDPPTWQKQYFINTSGFNSSCWGAHRVIDEPVSAHSSLYLNDGTILLKGEISVLRIRTSDGSTEAPQEVVKMFDPVYVQGILKSRYEGMECETDSLVGGNCRLAVDDGWQSGSVNHDRIWKSYIKHVIQGVDTVMQQIFTNAK